MIFKLINIIILNNCLKLLSKKVKTIRVGLFILEPFLQNCCNMKTTHKKSYIKFKNCKQKQP